MNPSNHLCLLAIMFGLAIIANATEPDSQAPSLAQSIAQLKSPDGDHRYAAAIAIGKFGKQAKPAMAALVAALRDEDDDAVATAIAQSLGAIGKPAVATLIEALGDDNPRVMIGAALALREIGPDAAPAVDALLRELQQNRRETREAVMHALGGIGAAAKPAVPLLIKLAEDDDDFHSQYRACIALGEIGPNAKAAAPLLIQLTQKGITSVRRHAAGALGGIGPAIGDQGLKALTDALRDRSFTVRASSVQALGRLQAFAKPALPVIKKALEDRQIEPRADAVEAIWRIAADVDLVLPLLVEEIQGDDSPEKAGELLAALGPAAKPAVPQLIAGLKSRDAFVRTNVAVALGLLGPLAKEAIGDLKKLAGDPDPTVRQAATAAIALINKPQ